MNQETLNALEAAAAARGRPLNAEERYIVITTAGQLASKDYWRNRFLNVIRSAGYKGNAPESICNEWLDKYMVDLPEFERMLESYEQRAKETT